MKLCENCNNEHDGLFGSGRFCSKKCSRAFSTKNKRKEINEKVSKKLKGSGQDDIKIICKFCKNIFIVHWNRRNQRCCSIKCSASYRCSDPEYIINLSNSLKVVCSSLESRQRLRDIGRKGGFGSRGNTKKGIHYQSNFEKNCFEWLEENKIQFIAHKNIPNSSKVSDIYLIEKDLWIELDGINREKKKKWLGNDYLYWLEKLKIYERENLNYKIFYKIEELKNYLAL